VTVPAPATYSNGMKRLLLPASALVLVVTACGAGAKPAPRVTELEARLLPNVHGLAERRAHAAAREAKKLLREFRPPPGAHRIGEPRNYGGVMRRSGPGPLGETVEVHRFWSVREPQKVVVAFLRAHRLRGFEHSSATWGSRKPHYLIMSSSRPPTRFLTVTTAGLPHRTLLRVGVQFVWTYPRSPSESVPDATREVVVSAPKASAKVTDPATVARILHWFDALPVSPPGIAVACPLGPAADITLSFRNGRGAWLAQAKLPPTPASICDSIAFSIGGRQQKPLIDRPERASFVRRLQDLLGVRLVLIYR
jgi:hypothetical protein